MSQHDDKERMPRAGDSPVPTADAGEAVSHLGQDDADDVEQDNERGGAGASRRRKAPRPPADRERPPAAGPHADPSLINPDATPGTGALPPAGETEDTDSTSG
jgi:hypothetical protein